jgi:hypothetical protein
MRLNQMILEADMSKMAAKVMKKPLMPVKKIDPRRKNSKTDHNCADHLEGQKPWVINHFEEVGWMDPDS